RLDTAGTESIQVSDSTDGIDGGTSLTVQPGVATALFSQSVQPVDAYHSFPVTVRAADLFGNTVTAYKGTVHFTSPDVAAVLPADYTFTSADQGVHTFSVTLGSLGADSIA